MPAKRTQADRVLEYIQICGSITRVDALLELGVANLTAVINTLRNRGINIETVEIDSTNRYGEKIKYARYILGKEAQE